MVRKNKEKQFWLINKSTKLDVSLYDLRITIRKGARVNLLSKHYHFTIDQLNQSAESGSIYKKRHLLAVHEIEPPSFNKPMIIEVSKPTILKPLRNIGIDIGMPFYEELDFEDEKISDEQFALEQAEAEELDRTPATLSVDKKYTKLLIDDE